MHLIDAARLAPATPHYIYKLTLRPLVTKDEFSSEIKHFMALSAGPFSPHVQHQPERHYREMEEFASTPHMRPRALSDGDLSSRWLSERNIQPCPSELRRSTSCPEAINTISIYEHGFCPAHADLNLNRCNLHSLSGSTSSIDTVADLLERFDANEERAKTQLSTDDITLIMAKRVFRHCASGTALADLLSYQHHPYAAGITISAMALVGLVDGAYKIGDKERRTDSSVLNFCRVFHQYMHKIAQHFPGEVRNVAKQLYYRCSLIAAMATVPADLLSHAYDGGIITAGVIPDIICPLTILVPTLLSACMVTCGSGDKTGECHFSGICLVLQRVIIHATAGTISADIAVYLGHPATGMVAILTMGGIGFIDGLAQCGELLLKKEPANPAQQLFQRFCQHIKGLYTRLLNCLPSGIDNLVGKFYLTTSIAGTAGTIIADIFSYFGNANERVLTTICPMVIGLLASLGTISSAVPEIVQWVVTPVRRPTAFLSHDSQLEPV